MKDEYKWDICHLKRNPDFNWDKFDNANYKIKYIKKEVVQEEIKPKFHTDELGTINKDSKHYQLTQRFNEGMGEYLERRNRLYESYFEKL